MSIHFHSEKIPFKLKNRKAIKQWLYAAILAEKKSPGEINFIFCTDAYLLGLNQNYLKHNTYTDIITFDYTDKKNNPSLIWGDIFISVERVKENASKFNVAIDDELHRVMIHGVLHLMGYKDKTKSAKLLMTKKEDFFLGKKNYPQRTRRMRKERREFVSIYNLQF